MKKCCELRVDGKRLGLRLTVAGQRTLKERFKEEVMQTILDAASDGEKMAALLDAALNWKGNENPIQDGEALFDLMVDDGWSGQEQFGALALEIAGASGLLREEQVMRMKASITQAVEEAMRSLETDEEQA